MRLADRAPGKQGAFRFGCVGERDPGKSAGEHELSAACAHADTRANHWIRFAAYTATQYLSLALGLAMSEFGGEAIAAQCRTLVRSSRALVKLLL
jgi:hypothetical protein